MKARPRALIVGTKAQRLEGLAAALEALTWAVDRVDDPGRALTRFRDQPAEMVALFADEYGDELLPRIAAFEAFEPVPALLLVASKDASFDELADRVFIMRRGEEAQVLEHAVELALERRRLLAEERNYRSLREKLEAVDGERSLPLFVGRHLTDVLERLSAGGGCVLAALPGRRGLQMVASLGLQENRLKQLCRHFENWRWVHSPDGCPPFVLEDDFSGGDRGRSLAVILCDGLELLGVLVVDRRGMTAFDSVQQRILLYGAGNLRLLLENDRALRDVSRSARNLESLKGQMIHAEKMAALGQLAAGIAHEINNPLTAIMGFAELLVKRAKDGDETFLRKIVDNAERVKRILLDLKDFYVPAQHRKSVVSLNGIVRNAIPIVRVHPDRRNIEVLTDLHEGVGSIFADENQVLQVLINLLMNAFHAMPDGGVIRLSTWPEGDRVAVSVTDQGRGIAPEQLSRIFDPFFTTKSDWKGTGLGLAVCYTIVEDHGGDVAVQSTLGEGSCFTVRFPQVEKSERPSSKETPLPPRSKPLLEGDEKRRLRILVVDDEVDCRSLMRELFEGFGHAVVEADRGEAAIECCRNEPFDVAFLDYKMPGLSGLETFRRLRELRAEMKIVVVTGSIGVTAEGLVRDGADGFLRKPFRAEEILSRLNALRDRPTTGRCTSRP